MNTENRKTASRRKTTRTAELLDRRPLVDPLREKIPILEPEAVADVPRRASRGGWALGFLVVASLAFAGALTARVLVPAVETVSAATDGSWTADGP